MKKILLFILLLPVFASAQRTIVIHGDTIFVKAGTDSATFNKITASGKRFAGDYGLFMDGYDALLAAKAAKATTDSMRTNIYAGLNGKQASGSYLVAADIAGKADLTSANLVTPNIGVATGTSLTVTGLIKSSGTAGIGYATGAGGTVTQLTSKATGATLNKISGEITLNAAALAAAAIVSFTLTNSTIAATDVLILNHVTTGTRGGYGLNAQCAAGSAVIYVRNNTAGSLSEAIVIRFVVIKSVNN